MRLFNFFNSFSFSYCSIINVTQTVVSALYYFHNKKAMKTVFSSFILYYTLTKSIRIQYIDKKKTDENSQQTSTANF